MQLTAVTAAAGGTAQKSTASTNALNYDAFLRLLVAQMQNQDPTSPQDSAQYLSQLASFAAVEQNIATNGKLDGLFAAVNLSQADALIGRTVSTADGTVSGVIKSIEIGEAGTAAILTDGTRLPLGPGVTVGER